MVFNVVLMFLFAGSFLLVKVSHPTESSSLRWSQITGGPAVGLFSRCFMVYPFVLWKAVSSILFSYVFIIFFLFSILFSSFFWFLSHSGIATRKHELSVKDKELIAWVLKHPLPAESPKWNVLPCDVLHGELGNLVTSELRLGSFQ